MSHYIKSIYIFILAFFLCLSAIAEAKWVVVRSLEDFKNTQSVEGARYIIKKEIDLGGGSIILPHNSKLCFKKGKLRNGSIKGDNTKLIFREGENIFGNCEVSGDWLSKYSYSNMFDNDLETMKLLRGLSSISSNIKLSSNREYHITAKGEYLTFEKLESLGKTKAIVRFHTIDPNLNGLIISGEHVVLRNLIIIDDYSVNNDVLYGKNDARIGSTLGFVGKNERVKELLIEGCDFFGGTSSSYVASAEVLNLTLKNSSFTGYISDHAVYCSTCIQSFVVDNCFINDVSHCGNGLFKVRASNTLTLFKLNKINTHNLHGYMGMLALSETPNLKIVIKDVRVTKDPEKNICFHGFCLNDDTKQMKGKNYNAKELIFENCVFEYGYLGNSIVYPGNGTPAVIKTIKYDHVTASESNFGGGISDSIIVSKSSFTSCIGNTGIAIKTKNLYIDNSHLSSDNHCNSILLMNYGNDRVKSVKLRGTTIDINSTYLAHINDGNKIGFEIDDCKISSLTRNLFSAPVDCDLHFNVKNSEIKANESYKEITIIRP